MLDSSRPALPRSPLPMDQEFHRADLMTPFSLSLAAEKAIENAKQKLDEMDSRLLKARTSIARAQRMGGRAVSNPERMMRGPGGRLFSEGNVRPTSEIRHQRVMSVDVSTEDGINKFTSRRHQNFVSVDSDIMDESLEQKSLEMKRLREDLRDLRSRMAQTRAISETLNLTPPRPPRPLDSEIPNLTRLDDEFAMRHHDLHRRLSNTLEDESIPIIATRAENPFSPRPYSSQSILTWDAPSSPSRRPPLSIRGSDLTRSSYLTARESFNPQRESSSSGTYSDPDTSQYSPTTPPSHIPRLKLRTGSSMSTCSFGSLTGLMNDGGLQQRVENAISRLATSEEDSHRRRKLEAALAILEEE